jgi:hypothetical protein
MDHRDIYISVEWINSVIVMFLILNVNTLAISG